MAPASARRPARSGRSARRRRHGSRARTTTRRPDAADPAAARGIRHERPPRLVAARHVQRGAHPGHHAGDLRVSRRPGHRRPAVHRPGHARALRARVPDGAGGARRQRRGRHDRRGDGYTPTPAVSHAILAHNRGRASGLADGIVITPSHNPPEDGGFKYNPPHGGPADTDVTRLDRDARQRAACRAASRRFRACPIERRVGAATTHALRLRRRVRRRSRRASWTWTSIRSAGLKIGVDPLGGASVAYWQPIAERYGLDARGREHRRRPDVPLHDRGLGRQDPHGLLVALRHGAADRAQGSLRRRVRQRSRRRPPRHRDAARPG